MTDTTLSRSDSGRPSFTTDFAASALLALYSLAVAAGFARVFAGWQFFDNMAMLVIAGHGTALALRRARVTGWVAVPATALVLTWLIGAMHYRDTYAFLLPTSDTWDLFSTELELVREQFRTAVAPVLYGAGWDVLAGIGLGMAVLLADTFAFRAYARAEALVPGGVLFVFVAALGSNRSRIGLTVVLIGAGVFATAMLRSYHSPARPIMMGRRRTPFGRIAPAGAAAAVVIAMLAGFVGPRIPGANAQPIYDTRGRGGGSVTEVVSPLVDIRSRLTNRSNSELFVVQATFESYWRSSALPRFDGTTWGLPERALRSTSGSLGDARTGSTELRQRVRIVSLGGSLVPAAADPVAASGPPEVDLRWNADSATLVKTGTELTTGEVYDIVSASPRFDAATLAAASSTDPGDPIYFELPDGFPGSVGEIAREVTAGASTPYEVALTLQNWFREFEYSLEVQAGHGTNAIEAFLRERVGYCEQFSGTYAAMMRSLGIPARVAVGFTSGTPRGDGSFSVLGKNAHAWPEVWFDGLGWVPFEPTPGRGAPGAENYTGIAPQQDLTGVDPDAPVAEPDENPVPTTIVPPDPDAADPALNIPEADLLDPGADSTSLPAEESTSSARTWLTIGLASALVLALIGPALVRSRRRRSSANAEVQLARLWRRALRALGDVGVTRVASHTPLETAALTSERFPVAARPMRSLAEVVTATEYSAAGSDALEHVGPLGTTVIRDCGNWCRQIERATADALSIGTRVRQYFTRLA